MSHKEEIWEEIENDVTLICWLSFFINILIFKIFWVLQTKTEIETFRILRLNPQTKFSRVKLVKCKSWSACKTKRKSGANIWFYCEKLLISSFISNGISRVSKHMRNIIALRLLQVAWYFWKIHAKYLFERKNIRGKNVRCEMKRSKMIPDDRLIIEVIIKPRLRWCERYNSTGLWFFFPFLFFIFRFFFRSQKLLTRENRKFGLSNVSTIFFSLWYW